MIALAATVACLAVGGFLLLMWHRRARSATPAIAQGLVTATHTESSRVYDRPLDHTSNHNTTGNQRTNRWRDRRPQTESDGDVHSNSIIAATNTRATAAKENPVAAIGHTGAGAPVPVGILATHAQGLGDTNADDLTPAPTKQQQQQQHPGSQQGKGRCSSSGNRPGGTPMPARPLTNPACKRCRVVAAKTACAYGMCRTCCVAGLENLCQAHNTLDSRVLAEIAETRLSRAKSLDLSYIHMEECPHSIGTLTVLVSLNLSNNQLKELPPDIGCLRSLEELFLQYNELQWLPDTIGNLDRLVELDCKNNHLTTIPASIGDMSRLRMLTLTNNRLVNLPPSIARLTSLQELSAHANCLTSLPELTGLNSLQSLYIGLNPLAHLPDSIGQLQSLSLLDSSSCMLTELPPSFMECRSLSRVWLSHNLLRSLPRDWTRMEGLTELFIQHNRLKVLPGSLAKLSLRSLNCFSNPFPRTQQELFADGLMIPIQYGRLTLHELAGRAIIQHHLLPRLAEYPRSVVGRRPKLLLPCPRIIAIHLCPWPHVCACWRP